MANNHVTALSPVILGVVDRRTFSKQKYALAKKGADYMLWPASDIDRNKIDEKIASISKLVDDLYWATGSLQIYLTKTHSTISSSAFFK